MCAFPGMLWILKINIHMENFPESEIPPFPNEIQEKAAEMMQRDSECMPERWMCVVVRREKT
jgi:hypothetical protein